MRKKNPQRGRTKRRNPLNSAEVTKVRAQVARLTRLAKKGSKAWRSIDLARAAGMLQTVCDFGRGKRRWSSCRTEAKILGRALRSAGADRGYWRKKRDAIRARNPVLQVVMPNRRRRKNPAIRGYAGRNGSRVRGGQRISKVGFVSPAEARTYPGFAKALETYRKFHGRAPTHFTRVRLEDGDAHVSRRAVVMIGEAPAIEYRTWRYANSSKSHTKDGRRITWRHKMGELGGKPAYYVHDPVSGVTSLLGGTYKVAGRPAFYHH